MAKTLFEAIGYRLGQKAAQAKNLFDLVGGTEEDSLRAEIRLGRDMAAALLERTPLVEENQSTRFAARKLGSWLAANVKEKKLPFAVRVTAEREPNAHGPPRRACLRELADVGDVPDGSGTKSRSCSAMRWRISCGGTPSIGSLKTPRFLCCCANPPAGTPPAPG